ncbi:MAG: nucleotide-binding protein [Saprospiraceae bacterium]|nr:nucleotide-binding protein [Saprospiraceae bacterium]MBK6667362.1 nucleotide-binding protein [Saprospiraceae bacterium]MBK8825249.1 nucleotide-binding protein [Saprospiraceae bacterium]MBK8888183.1 nucleotide-binding protein [Saprospiraceae bacterium]
MQAILIMKGYFFALLGRNKVICLQENGVEVPSDISGRMYINIDENDKWKFSLIKELKHAGFDVTADKL